MVALGGGGVLYEMCKKAMITKNYKVFPFLNLNPKSNVIYILLHRSWMTPFVKKCHPTFTMGARAGEGVYHLKSRLT